MAGNASLGTSLTWKGTAVSDIVSIDGPNESVETVDVSSLGSTVTTYDVATPTDGGEITLELNDYGAEFAVGETGAVVVSYADSGSGTAGCDAICTSISPKDSLGDKHTTTVVLKVTGAVS